MDDTRTRPEATGLMPLAHRASHDTYFNAEKFALAQRVATVFAQSQLVPDHLRNKMPDCLIALEMAEAMGESPLRSGLCLGGNGAFPHPPH